MSVIAILHQSSLFGKYSILGVVSFEREPQISAVFLSKSGAGDELLNEIMHSGNVGVISRPKDSYTADIAFVIPEEHADEVAILDDIVPDPDVPSLTALVAAGLIEILVIPPHDAILPEGLTAANRR